MYGPQYGYGRPMPRRPMHVCPGCSMQVPYGMACGGCYMPWDPTAFLVAEFMEEVVEEIAFGGGFGGPMVVEETVIVDETVYDGGGDTYYDGGYDDGGSDW